MCVISIPEPGGACMDPAPSSSLLIFAKAKSRREARSVRCQRSSSRVSAGHKTPEMQNGLKLNPLLPCCSILLPRVTTPFLQTTLAVWASERPGAPDCLPPQRDAVQRALRSASPPLCLFNGRGSAPLLIPSGTTSGLATHTH